MARKLGVRDRGRISKGFQARLEELVQAKGGFGALSRTYEPSALYRWMVGETKPGFWSMHQLAKDGVDLNWLLTGEKR